MKHWLHRFAYAGCLDSDTESERLSKAILVSIPTSISLLAILWVSGYLILNRPLSAAIPGVYAFFSLLSVLVFFKTKHYGFFRFSQLLLILLLPFLLQWSLGGFNSGSAVMIWAILSPIGALMFHGVRQAIPWFVAYIALTILSGVLDSQLAAAVAPLPDIVITIFYVMNISCATLIMYVVVNYFVVDNSRIISALSEEKSKTEKTLAEVKRAKNIIEEQSKKLIEMDRIKSRFFSNISHEFRTPLTLVIGPLEDCLDGGSPPPKSQIKVMLRNCLRLMRLINQLLDISKIEACQMKLDVQRGDLQLFVDEICQVFSAYAERKQIEFTKELGQNKTMMSFDQEKLDKILNNLLSNAIKFTPSGGRVRLKLSEIIEHGREGICISILDTGPGIPEKDIPNIFNRFYQVDGSSTREHEGTGIGLSLVKELIELHEGTIRVSSNVGFGTEFTVFLPKHMDDLHIAQAMEQNTADSGPESVPVNGEQTIDVEMSTIINELATQPQADIAVNSIEGMNTSQSSVLVVDDNRDIREYLISCLTPEFRVLQAGDGEQGLKVATEYQPDLVICDIMMPVMDGYELCQALREDPVLNHIPVIFLTAKASEDMKLEGLEVGADDYIAKPFSAKELIVRTRNLINLRNREKEVKHLNQQLEQKVKDQLEELISNKRLASYFSAGLLKKLLTNNDAAELITERRNITILFCDLCNFTDMSDRIEAEQAALLLNEFLTEITKLADQSGGTVIQIIGDAIMVFFGAPEDMENKEQAKKAVQLAVAIQQKIEKLSSNWLEAGLDYRAQSRIGIHQDFVTVGNFGSPNMMEYTAVGKGVNLASRLESSCTPGRIKISYPVYLLTKTDFPYEPISDENFKGFARSMKVCELDPLKTKISP